jgi:hypothetical protein
MYAQSERIRPRRSATRNAEFRGNARLQEPQQAGFALTLNRRKLSAKNLSSTNSSCNSYSMYLF